MKNNKLFIAWGVLVVILIVLLTVLGFMLKHKSGDYQDLENKLVDSAKKYVDIQFLYPEEGQETKVLSSTLIENQYLDELKTNKDTCNGYVIVTFHNVYKYQAYIKCNQYKTNGYQK